MEHGVYRENQTMNQRNELDEVISATGKNKARKNRKHQELGAVR